MIHIKYLLFVLLSVVASFSQPFYFLIAGIIELTLIFGITSVANSRNKTVGYWLNLALCIPFFIQQTVWIFAGEYVSILMLENMNMVSNLGSLLPIYIVSFAIGILVSLLPAPAKRLSRTGKGVLCSSLLVYAVTAAIITLMTQRPFTPYTATGQLAQKAITAAVARLQQDKTDKETILRQFHKNGIIPGKNHTVSLNNNRPNIIVIFTEGLSAEILDVYNNLSMNITPNIDSLYAHSLVFDNYYNHTAATFRGLRGQLYSSHQSLGGSNADQIGFGQMGDDEMQKKTSTRLISLIDILNEYGYYTSFVNVEGNSPSTTTYLESLKFDKVENSERSLSDREGFDMLWDKVKNAEEPYFIGFYNIGTHHGFDSPDKKYGNGMDAVLNRFHNYDAQLGTFLDSLNTHATLDNTLLVFTTDHASYPSPEYKKAFRSSSAYFINRIPLFLCGAGIQPGHIDAKGRNSLCLTPTLLDLLQIHDRENYFLGTSLLNDTPGTYDTCSAIGQEFFRTSSQGVEPIRGRKHPIPDIKQYYIISVNED